MDIIAINAVDIHWLTDPRKLILITTVLSTVWNRNTEQTLLVILIKQTKKHKGAQINKKSFWGGHLDIKDVC